MTQQRQTYACLKCNNNSYVTDEFRATGGGFSRFFDVQNKKFTTVSCSQCGYTEIYRGDTSKWGNVADFLLGG